MQASSIPGNVAQQGQASDVATKIAVAMRAMGVSGLPRNYEIFHEVFTGSNAALNAEVHALGSRPRQEDLDRISIKYFVQSSNNLFVENVREQIANKIEEVMILFDKERLQLERYGNILHQSSDGLNKRNALTRELLQRVAGIMTTATDNKIEQGRQLVSSIKDTSAELEEVKGKLEEYKRLADTDPMTQLANRRAFDREMARIYDDPKRVLYSALIIGDIDRFKQINDRFGHPVGDKIIQHVATVLRAKLPADVFLARTGGEEFAAIVDGLSEEGALELADVMRTAIEKLAFGGTGANWGPITVSFGVCAATRADGADDLYSKADRALYVSKANGRNQITNFAAIADNNFVKGWKIYQRS